MLIQRVALPDWKEWQSLQALTTYTHEKNHTGSIHRQSSNPPAHCPKLGMANRMADREIALKSLRKHQTSDASAVILSLLPYNSPYDSIRDS